MSRPQSPLSPSRRAAPEGRVRYAVVGLGWIAQAAVLPAFARARRNSELVALFSNDSAKLHALGRKYGVKNLYSYDQYERGLEESGADAVFIALPNTMHREYTERAARVGLHVLCEKPMAMTVEDAEGMIRECRGAGVRLMVAYRLHFEKANLEAVRVVQSGKLGEERLFDSVFTQNVEPGNLRLRAGEGGPLFDLGIYCLNAARYLFRAEPEEVSGWHHTRTDDPRFRDCPETTSATLRFPGDRLASFTCSFGSSGVSAYEVVGTEASLRVDPAYGIAKELVHHLRSRGKVRTKSFPASDQFAAELLYFSACILENREPEPSGEEGLADVRVLAAIDRSAREGGRRIALPPFHRDRRPGPEQAIHRPAGKEPELVHAQDPSPQ
jgi:predicted dehydrogenase